MRITTGKHIHYFRKVFSNQKRLETQVDVGWPGDFRFELGISIYPPTNITISLGFLFIELSRKCDHAGIEFKFEPPGMIAEFRFVDNRHWNYKTKDWEKYYGESDE